MDTLNGFQNLCRVCLRDDLNDDNQITYLNRQRTEKLTYIGDSSEIVRLDSGPIPLCIKCDIKLDLVYEFVVKFNSSKAKLREYARLYDPYQVVDLNLEAIEDFTDQEGNNIVKVEPPDEFPESPEFQHGVLDDPIETDTQKFESIVTANSFTIGPIPSPEIVYKSKIQSEKKSQLQKLKIEKLQIIKQETKLEPEATRSVCYICDKEFSTRANMLRHVREHVGRRFVCECEGCKSYFTQKSSLQVHIARHKGLKPYECELCGKKFSQSKSLVFHRRVHTGESPYECENCDKKFKQKSNLIRHFICHSKPTKPRQKRFSCTKCDKYLASKQSLVRYLVRHERMDDITTELKIEPNISSAETTTTTSLKIEKYIF